MAHGNQTKAERRQARESAGTTKAERREARSGKGGKKAKRGGKPGRQAAGDTAGPVEDASLEERIDWRLARIEEAVAKQSERSDELLQRVTDLLDSGSEGTAGKD